ncbi:MAG: amidohydrolase family protein [Bryobacterales bacterium]|nr:amidohydrolase family protein [Bryobacterales bacterium]MBV9400575.1 amidohydrolase family protein [Bryobacterales bacterium]
MTCKDGYIFSNELIDLEFDRTISHVDPVLNARAEAAPTWLAPGFIDLQVNGFAGVDFNSPATQGESMAAAMDAIFATGVTRFFPTVITASPERILSALANLARIRETLPRGEAMEAFHVEGPHISAEDGPRGAHPAAWVRAPDIEEYKRWQDAAGGDVRLITLAPEWPQATRYIEHITGEGVVASIGHTAATAEQIRDAVHAGATLSTHLGNAGHPTLPRHRNYLWEQLAEDRLAASFIVDAFHLPDAFLRVALRSKGVDRSVLVTDAVGPTIGEVELDHLADDRVVLKGGSRLAGSGLRMDRAIANTVRRTGVGLGEAVAMATINPARVGRVRGRLRGLQPGERADVVRFRWDDGVLSILETYLSGERVFGEV